MLHLENVPTAASMRDARVVTAHLDQAHAADLRKMSQVRE